MLDPRTDLIATARYFYRQGWMMGTAGNLSARSPDGSFWIAESRSSRRELSIDDFVSIAIDSSANKQSSLDRFPVEESVIHQTLYSLFPDTQACYHIHSVEANLVSRFVWEDSLLLPPLEMLKGLGVWEEKPCCRISIFPNYLQADRIAAEIQKRFQKSPPQIPALLIRDRGVVVWASSPETARNYIELIQYIFGYAIASRQLGIQKWHNDCYDLLV